MAVKTSDVDNCFRELGMPAVTQQINEAGTHWDVLKNLARSVGLAKKSCATITTTGIGLDRNDPGKLHGLLQAMKQTSATGFLCTDSHILCVIKGYVIDPQLMSTAP